MLGESCIRMVEFFVRQYGKYGEYISVTVISFSNGNLLSLFFFLLKSVEVLEN
jgi:hypothetical protein